MFLKDGVWGVGVKRKEGGERGGEDRGEVLLCKILCVGQREIGWDNM